MDDGAQRPPDREPAVGDLLGNYRLEALAGEGGMGRVFRARHERLGRTVAVKVLRRRHSGRPATIARFFQEARAVNVIRHPNIVEITDFVEVASGDSYYIMEWLDGETLAARLRRDGALPAEAAVAIARPIARALAAAHRAGFIHRDLTPGNIHVRAAGPGLEVKVLDFGVALLDGTSDGAVAGTPAYLSPEIAAGRSVDGRSDVYSLGVVLHEMLAGEPPFEADGLAGFVMKHMTATPPPLRGLAPWPVPPSLTAIVERCLRKSPDERFPSMDALADALDAVAPPPRRVPRWLAPIAIAALAVAGGALWVTHRPAAFARAPAPPPTIAPPPAPPVILPTRIHVAVQSLPPGAEVWSEDGAVLGVTPCRVLLPAGDQRLELRLPGYQNTLATVGVTAGASLSVALEPNAPPRRHAVTAAPKPAQRNHTIDPFRE